MEQDHRGIKQRYYPMRGFGSVASAARFCTAHDELRDHLRYRRHLKETVPLAEQRRLFRERWDALLQAASPTATPAHDGPMRATADSFSQS